MSTTIEKDLIKVLRALLKKMQAKGMAAGIKDQEQFIEKLASKISSARKNLTTDDLKNVAFQKLLCVALISQHLLNKSPNKNLHFNFEKLFDEKLLLTLDPKNSKQMKALEKTFKFLLSKVNELQPNKVSQEVIDKQAITLATTFLNRFLDSPKPKPANTLAIANTINELLEETMRQLFGGITKPGGIVATVYQIAGNFFGIADQQGGNEVSMAFLDEVNRYDGKADYNGIENENFKRDIAIEGSFIDNLLAEPSSTPSPSRTPFSTKLTPPGTEK